MTVACIVQARLGSHRFPRKVLADLWGKPVVEHVLTRCQKIKGVDCVVLATPADWEHLQAFKPITDRLGVALYGGSELDVLDRYYNAAKQIGATRIMRITADCPLIDPELCSTVLDRAAQSALAYCSNSWPVRTYETGLDCEVFSFEALETAEFEAKSDYDREHVTPYMQRNAHPQGLVRSGDQTRALTNLCVDYPEDLERVREIGACR